MNQAARTPPPLPHDSSRRVSLPSGTAALAVTAAALVLVFLTRWPVARLAPLESDEFGFLEQVRLHWFPMHHTLFLTFGRLLGVVLDEPYHGFLVLDMIVSGLALASTWWWLRSLVEPAAAAAGTIALGLAPLFWGYGAIAANYTAIIAVGSFLLGVARRGMLAPAPWQPVAAAVVLALGTGYRQDIGTLWLPVLLVIFWQHRWRRAILCGLLFAAMNVAWLLAMLHEAGGWARYRAQSAEFAYTAGYLNSIWSLGLVDAPVRYGVKLGMALLWTLGPCLLFAPRGALRLARDRAGWFLLALFALTFVPALGSHLLVHFGVPGYSFHYVPGLLALSVVGIGQAAAPRARQSEPAPSDPGLPRYTGRAPVRLLGVTLLMAGLFLFYPTNYGRPGWRGDFDLAFARFTRAGLRTPIPGRSLETWRTANSRALAGTPRGGSHEAAPVR